MVSMLSYVIAVVDSSGEFLKRVEVELQDVVSGYDVLGYDDADQLLHEVEKHTFQVPLLIIADFAARHPSIQEGIFNRVCKKVPRARGIYFCSQPNLDECREMLRIGILADVVIRRGTQDDIEQLAYSTEKFMNSFKLSADYQLISYLAESIELIPEPENHFVNTNQGALSLSQALLEMAKKTPIGESALRTLLSTNLLQNNKMVLANTKGVIDWTDEEADLVVDVATRPLKRALIFLLIGYAVIMIEITAIIISFLLRK